MMYRYVVKADREVQPEIDRRVIRAVQGTLVLEGRKESSQAEKENRSLQGSNLPSN